MSKLNTGTAAGSSEVVIIDSSLMLEHDIPVNVERSFSKTIQLEKFPGASWTLTTFYYRYDIGSEKEADVSFLFQIVNFPVELQENCFTEFRVKFSGYSDPAISEKTAFQSSFKSAIYYVTSNTFFTANLIITKKRPICSAEFLRKTLLDGVVNMYTDKAISDFTFTVKGKQFKVHKLILGASSPVMYKLFTAEFQEKETNECQIEDIEPDIFEALIGFMYRCSAPKNISAHKLYEAAHYYEIETLKKICLDEIRNKLSKANAIESYALACKYDLGKLSADSWMIIERNILMICNGKVKPMPPAEVEKIVEIREKRQAEILKLNKKIESENLAFVQMEQAILQNYFEAGKP